MVLRCSCCWCFCGSSCFLWHLLCYQVLARRLALSTLTKGWTYGACVASAPYGWWRTSMHQHPTVHGPARQCAHVRGGSMARHGVRAAVVAAAAVGGGGGGGMAAAAAAVTAAGTAVVEAAAVVVVAVAVEVGG